MNRGLRSAMALGDGLLPTRTGLYAFEVLFHKLLRRFVGFFLVALLASTVALAAADPTWWLLLGPQLGFYALAAAGADWRRTRAGAGSSRSGSRTSSAWRTRRPRWPCSRCSPASASSAGSRSPCAAGWRGADAVRCRRAPAAASRAWPSPARGACCRRPTGRAPGRALLPLGRPAAELPRAHAGPVRRAPRLARRALPGGAARGARRRDRGAAAGRTWRSPSTTATPTTTPTRCRCCAQGTWRRASSSRSASSSATTRSCRTWRRSGQRRPSSCARSRGARWPSCAPRACRSARTPGAIATSPTFRSTRSRPICAARGSVLEQRLGEPVRAIAYPWGKLGRHVNERDVHGRAAGRLRARPDLAAARAAPRRRSAADRAARRRRRLGRAPRRQGHRRDRLARVRARAHPRSRRPPDLRRGRERVVPQVDAIITCHNYGRFLGEAIESVARPEPPERERRRGGRRVDRRDGRGRRALRRPRRPLRPPARAAAPAKRATPASRSPQRRWWPSSTRTTPGCRTGSRSACAPRAPPRGRAGRRARVRVRRGHASLQHRPRAARAGVRPGVRRAADPQRRPQPELRADPALGARGGGRVQRAAGRPGLGHLAGGREALPDRLHRRGGGARQAPHERHHAPQRAASASTCSCGVVDRHLPDVHPAWRRPLLRRAAASAACLHAGLGSAIQGDQRVARRYAIEALALDPFTLARRKLALLARVFVSESLVRRLSHALRDDARLAERAHRPSGREARCVTSGAARSAA